MPPRKITEYYLDKFNDHPTLQGCTFKRKEQVNYKQHWEHDCDVCSSDEYVKRGYCVGWFRTNTNQLLKGIRACRCSIGYKWNEHTLYGRVELLCESLNYTFRGWSGEFKGYRTLCRVSCNTCSHVFPKSCDINELLHGKEPMRCTGCKRIESAIKAERICKEEFLEADYMVFGSSSTLEVICKNCSFDKYVSAGLCSGVFKTTSTSLRKGQKPCRCSSSPRFTQEQREFQIKEIMRGEGGSLTFVKWDTKFTCVDHTYFIYECVKHGEKRINLNNFINNKRRCKGCRDEKMRWRNYSERYAEKDYLYNAFTADDETFSKIGRTFVVSRRERDYKNTEYSFDFEVIYASTHYKVYHLEQALHRYFRDSHYTPSHPFGGSIKECFNVTHQQVKDALVILEPTIPELPPA